MRDTSTSAWTVEISTKGPCGTIFYREGANTASFGWQFGGGDVVAIISVGFANRWDATHVWAAGRREEILERMIGEVIRQKAKTCEPTRDEAHGAILLRERRSST